MVKTVSRKATDMLPTTRAVIAGLDFDLGYERAEDIKSEIADMEQEVKDIQARIANRKDTAISEGFAAMVTDPDYTPQKRVPDAKTYIKLHGQEDFDANHKLTTQKPRFAWLS